MGAYHPAQNQQQKQTTLAWVGLSRVSLLQDCDLHGICFEAVQHGCSMALAPFYRVAKMAVYFPCAGESFLGLLLSCAVNRFANSSVTVRLALRFLYPGCQTHPICAFCSAPPVTILLTFLVVTG
ncbi:unnamed protein product [Ostreobium quekettii]|uniref:Uncharacterized protein n=1 Tax=Ostreobium quekettii TaxID=121088 RepID=A0A8S1JFN4_9CHLO|nr:unnamed protein product [Ostreobium quekettii]